ncbi:TPA: hypothetical protein SLU51_004856 [Pseudomonas aeruginosa]|uniref:hypothetical protein n=1 Tax=Pseudomonas aeruginosa TaxID=287 RepID=UPI00071B3D98|nr:hypothetical protein [Pseudomonas aeruginosa]KSD37946.1 hypothetical protein AO902_08820 [Pseudomonas aeruginosa]HEJ1227528.1 hypothetical protein [Pseudomonas aeruginosa]HEJ3395126.1 hypothetical protein [Pseudomonas aeruginosa]HEJ5019313.1 hypothetical protein [Pseudomonas aeruginosa]
MKILKGYVLGVVDKGEGDKRWAIVGIKATDKDRDGFDVDTTYKLRVFGDAVKNGLHNAYRSLAGVEVYAPYNDEFDEKYKRISYSLAGAPLALMEKPLGTAQPKPAAPAQPVRQAS